MGLGMLKQAGPKIQFPDHVLQDLLFPALSCAEHWLEFHRNDTACRSVRWKPRGAQYGGGALGGGQRGPIG